MPITVRTEYVVYDTSKEDDFWFYSDPMTLEQCEEFIKFHQKNNPERTYKIIKREVKEEDFKEYPAKDREKKVNK